MQWPPTSRLEIEEIPLSRRGSEHVSGVNTELMKDRRQLVHQGDVEIALRVFDDLGGLGNFNRGGAMNPSFHHRTIHVSKDIERTRILSGHHFRNGLKAVLLVAGIDAFRRIADCEIAPAGEGRFLFKHRQTFFFNRAGVDRRFINHDVSALEHFADRFGSQNERSEIGSACPIDRRRYRHDIKICAGKA
jgi:hypothetical protein